MYYYMWWWWARIVTKKAILCSKQKNEKGWRKRKRWKLFKHWSDAEHKSWLIFGPILHPSNRHSLPPTESPTIWLKCPKLAHSVCTFLLCVERILEFKGAMFVISYAFHHLFGYYVLLIIVDKHYCWRRIRCTDGPHILQQAIRTKSINGLPSTVCVHVLTMNCNGHNATPSNIMSDTKYANTFSNFDELLWPLTHIPYLPVIAAFRSFFAQITTQKCHYKMVIKIKIQKVEFIFFSHSSQNFLSSSLFRSLLFLWPSFG